MRQRKETSDSGNSTKSKPKSITKLFGYLKTKIKGGINELTSMTSYSENAGRQQEVIASPQNIVHCPIPKPPRRPSTSIHNQKPVQISKQHDQLLAMQVQKCYRNLPEVYFMKNYEIDKSLFSKSLKSNNQKLFQLNDQLDEVQFNVQQLVKSKQKQLLVALENMNTMDSDIHQLLGNLKDLRANNKQLKNKLIGKSQIIRELQSKSDKLTKMSNALNHMKWLLSYPQMIKNTFPRDRLLAVKQFKEYLRIHETYKSLCGCSSNIQRNKCQYESVKEGLKMGFQQTFSKSYWNYITEGLFYQQNQLKNIFGVKKDFLSMPGMAAGFSLAAFIASGTLDESICQQEKYELAIKQNVQEEIKLLILAGIQVCDFDNAHLLTNLQEFMQDFEKSFLSDILVEVKESFMMETDNQFVVQSKGIKLLLQELTPLIQKVKSNKFIKLVNFYSQIAKKAIRRTYSILHRVLKSFETKKIKNISHIQVSLVEVCFQVTTFIDKYLSKLIELGQIPKQQNMSTFRDLVQIFEDWEDFTKQIDDYFISDIHSQSGAVGKGICKLQNLEDLKIKLAGQHLKGFHQNVLSRQLKNSMEQDAWVETDVDPKYYNILGYILEGEKFNEDRKRLGLLSSSLFLDKKPINQSRQMNFDYFSISHNEIVIHNRRYKPTSSLLVLVQIIQEYLKMNQIGKQMSQEVSSKLLQLLNYYNNFLFQLILNASAVHHNKIGNSITIRHLCLSHHAVSFLLTVVNFFKQRFEQVRVEKIAKLMEKMISHQQEIIKKIQSIIPHRILQQAKLITLQKSGPSKGTENIAGYLRNINDTLKQYFQEQQIRRILNSGMISSFIQKLLKLRPKTKAEEEILELDISYFLIETQFLSGSMSGYEDIKKQLTNILKFK